MSKGGEVINITIVTSLSTRTGSYTQVHRCRSCGRAFWGKSDWNRVSVKCPHCAAIN